MNDLIRVMPAIALRGTTILPDMIVHFDISRPKSIKAVEAAMTQNQKIFLVTQKDIMIENPGEAQLHRIGTIARIKQVVKMPKDVLRVLVEGVERAELLELDEEKPYLLSKVALFEIEEEEISETMKEAMMCELKDIFGEFVKTDQKINKELAAQIMETKELERLVDQICVNIPLHYEKRQQLLETIRLSERYDVLNVILSNEVEVLKIRTEFQEKVKARIDEHQKEYILREQLKLIREELGEDDTISDADQFIKQVESLKASKEVKENC